MRKVISLERFKKEVAAREEDERKKGELTEFLAQAYIDYIDVSMHINEFNVGLRLLENGVVELGMEAVRVSLIEINKYNRKYSNSFPKVIACKIDGRQKLDFNYQI